MLEEGRIVQNQVTYKSIESSLVDVLGKGKSKKPSETESSMQTVDVQKPAEPQTRLPMIQDTKDSGRQTGDIECYKIYIQSIGLLIISVCFSISAITSALEAMPSTYSSAEADYPGYLANKMKPRCYAKVLDRKRRRSYFHRLSWGLYWFCLQCRVIWITRH